MVLRRGDVVLVQYPFASGMGEKLRPAVVVQNDRDNRRLANVIFAPITTRIHHSGEPTQRLIDPASQKGSGSGLKHVSVVTCENLTTVTKQRIIQRMGSLPSAVMSDIDLCLKFALELR